MARYPIGADYEGTSAMGTPRAGPRGLCRRRHLRGRLVQGAIEGEGIATYATACATRAGPRRPLSGPGAMTGRDGYRYEGDWVGGQEAGPRSRTYPDGSTYVADLRGHARGDRPARARRRHDQRGSWRGDAIHGQRSTPPRPAPASLRRPPMRAARALHPRPTASVPGSLGGGPSRARPGPNTSTVRSTRASGSPARNTARATVQPRRHPPTPAFQRRRRTAGRLELADGPSTRAISATARPRPRPLHGNDGVTYGGTGRRGDQGQGTMRYADGLTYVGGFRGARSTARGC